MEKNNNFGPPVSVSEWGGGGGAGSEGGGRGREKEAVEISVVGAKAIREGENARSQSRSIKKGSLLVLLKWLDGGETRLFRACSSSVGSTCLMSHIPRPKVLIQSETQSICYHTVLLSRDEPVKSLPNHTTTLDHAWYPEQVVLVPV